MDVYFAPDYPSFWSRKKMIEKDAGRKKKMMRAREAGKYLTYPNSTFHVHGSLRYAAFLAGLIILQLRP